MTPAKTELIETALLKLPANFTPDKDRLAIMVASIRDQGLLAAPLIKDNYEVFGGKMRAFACKELKLEQIQCQVYPSTLSEEEYKILSLHENLKRFNLPWDEQVQKERELHDLRQNQFGKGERGKKTGWSLRDTANELQMSFGVLSEDIRIAQAIELDPSLKRIKDKITARKVIFDTIKRSNQEISSSAPISVAYNVCLHGGSEAVLRVYPDNVFDACITDPPWLEFKDKSLTRDEFTLPVFKEVFRVLKHGSFLYSFVSTQDWLFYQEKLAEIGFSVQKWPLIWIKEGVLSMGTRSWEHQRDYEPILLAVKDSPALVDKMISSIISCKVVPSGLLTHPNEKPREVIKRLLNYCTYDGALVLDPFAGSFVVADVCKEMGRKYVAIENNAKYFEQGKERLKC